ncbi:Ferredoxin--NADP reductase [Rubripirellula tenax]|uniref:Ferredoxin--NADP reductase n=1 Tax=Rubripirellula tenax TaxID=2528015 RepID=A0A5C6FFL5_9BACT|nr:NAD(P)-binding domain-containing protein [Rubripirellula tenax]TWU59330.1 Ferredoxin--NADP reductase [Rubripirellula tenax]
MTPSEASSPSRCDAVVIGGGPIGIETAIALNAAKIECRVLEAGSIGHTISWWAPQTRWFSSNDRISIAGVPLQTIDQNKATREEYLNYLRSVVQQFRVPITSFTRVISVDRGDDNDWLVRTVASHHADSESSHPVDQPATVQTILASNVVLAIGGTDRPNRLGVEGEELPMVDGYLREPHRYHGRRVLIVGGRNSAVEAAIRLHRVGAKVTLCYHGPSLPTESIKYWLRPEIEGLVRSGAIEAAFGSRVVKIEPGCVVLNQIGEDGSVQRVSVAVDDVLTLIGYQQDKSLFKQMGIPLSGPALAPVFNPVTMETDLPGIYVAGTAIGGTQSSKYQIFLENCHDHSTKIAKDIVAKRSREGQTAAGEGTDTSAADRQLARQIELSPES